MPDEALIGRVESMLDGRQMVRESALLSAQSDVHTLEYLNFPSVLFGLAVQPVPNGLQ
jgi:hypothetical protein